MLKWIKMGFWLLLVGMIPIGGKHNFENVKVAEVMKVIKPKAEIVPGDAFSIEMNRRIDAHAQSQGIERKDLVSTFYYRYEMDKAIEILVSAYGLKWKEKLTSLWTFVAEGVENPIVFELIGLTPTSNLVTGINFSIDHPELFGNKAVVLEAGPSAYWPRPSELRAMTAKQMRSIVEATALGNTLKSQSYVCSLNNWEIKNDYVKSITVIAQMNWTLETPYQITVDGKNINGSIFLTINKN